MDDCFGRQPFVKVVPATEEIRVDAHDQVVRCIARNTILDPDPNIIRRVLGNFATGVIVANRDLTSQYLHADRMANLRSKVGANVSASMAQGEYAMRPLSPRTIRWMVGIAATG